MDGDLGEAKPGHFEHADFSGGAETILRGAQHPKVVRAVPLEGQHRVDHVLDDARPGHLAVLGHMPDQNDRGAAVLGVAQQRLALARTCVTVPGDDSTVSVCMVWIESMTISAARLPVEQVAKISSTWVALASSTDASARSSRAARNRTCATASSPEM